MYNFVSKRQAIWLNNLHANHVFPFSSPENHHNLQWHCKIFEKISCHRIEKKSSRWEHLENTMSHPVVMGGRHRRPNLYDRKLSSISWEKFPKHSLVSSIYTPTGLHNTNRETRDGLQVALYIMKRHNERVKAKQYFPENLEVLSRLSTDTRHCKSLRWN